MAAPEALRPRPPAFCAANYGCDAAAPAVAAAAPEAAAPSAKGHDERDDGGGGRRGTPSLVSDARGIPPSVGL